MKLSRSRVGGAIVVLALTWAGTAPGIGTARRLPPPARVGCGDSGVAGIGFTVYVCGSGAGGTKYAHWPELLVVRSNGSYRGYRDAFSQDDLVRRLPRGGVIATHNDGIVRIAASSLTTVVGERRLSFVPGSPRMGSIDALTVDSSGDIFLRANYYVRSRHGCENVRWELTARRRLRLLGRSRTGLTCG